MMFPDAWMIYLGICLISYLVGSFSFAIILSMIFNLPDPRQVGSKNPGATNILRSGKKAVALLTLAGDALKGWLCVFAAQNLVITGGLEGIAAMAGFFAFLGHLYPVWFAFKGGKGVATALGVLLGLFPQIAGLSVLVFISIVVLFRYVSLASMLAAVSAAVLANVFHTDLITQLFVWAMVLLLIWRHRSNIKKLLSGQENKVFSGKKAG